METNEEFLTRWTNNIEHELIVKNYDALKYKLRELIREHSDKLNISAVSNSCLEDEYNRGWNDGFNAGADK